MWRSLKVNGSDHKQLVGTNCDTYCRLCDDESKNNMKQSRDKGDQSTIHKSNDTDYIKERSFGVCLCGSCAKQRKTTGNRIRNKIPRRCGPKPAMIDEPVVLKKAEDPVRHDQPSQGCRYDVPETVMKSTDKAEVDELRREADSLKTDRLRLEQRLKWIEVSLKRLQEERDELLPRIEHKKKEESDKQAELISRNEQKTATGMDQKSTPSPVNRDIRTTNEQYLNAPPTIGSCIEKRCNCRLSTATLEFTRSEKPRTTANQILKQLPRRPESSYIDCDTNIAATNSELDREKPQPELTSHVLAPRSKKSFVPETPEEFCSTATSDQSQRDLSILDHHGLSEKKSSGTPQIRRNSLPSSSSHCSECSDCSSLDEFCGPMPASMKKPYNVSDCVSKVCGYVLTKAKHLQSNATVSKKNEWRNDPVLTRCLQNEQKDVYTWENVTPFDRTKHHNNTSYFTQRPK